MHEGRLLPGRHAQISLHTRQSCSAILSSRGKRLWGDTLRHHTRIQTKKKFPKQPEHAQIGTQQIYCHRPSQASSTPSRHMHSLHGPPLTNTSPSATLTIYPSTARSTMMCTVQATSTHSLPTHMAPGSISQHQHSHRTLPCTFERRTLGSSMDPSRSAPHPHDHHAEPTTGPPDHRDHTQQMLATSPATTHLVQLHATALARR